MVGKEFYVGYNELKEAWISTDPNFSYSRVFLFRDENENGPENRGENKRSFQWPGSKASDPG